MANFWTRVSSLEGKDQAHNPAAAGSRVQIPPPQPPLRGFSMAWVYVIQNAEGRFYIGITADLEQRLSDHNNGVSKWTKHRGPWSIVWWQECRTIGDLAALPGNRFENLKGDRKGQCSIRINDLLRIEESNLSGKSVTKLRGVPG
jgi:predicted GIY-YIG superfamily endonuclease